MVDILVNVSDLIVKCQEFGDFEDLLFETDGNTGGGSNLAPNVDLR